MKTEKMTLEEAEGILAACAVGMFRGTTQEMLIAQNIVDNAIKDEQEGQK